MALLILMINAGATPTHADDTFQLGWFERIPDVESIESVAGPGQADVILPYNWKVDPDQVQTYLDEAVKHGVQVIVEVPRKPIDEDRLEEVEAFVKRFDEHPAVQGWYTADEPVSAQKWSVDLMERTYDAVKRQSDKPVYICFSYGETRRGEVADFKNAFDVMMFNAYPYRLNPDDPAGGAIEYAGAPFWTQWIDKFADLARELDKPWWNTLQCTGQVPYHTKRDFRLPSYGEARYQLYKSVVNDAQGVLYWAHYVMHNSTGHANYTYPSNDPYPHDGTTWFGEIYQPLAERFVSIQPALAPGNAVRGVRKNSEDFDAKLYRQPDEDGFVLILVNSHSWSGRKGTTPSQEPQDVVVRLPFRPEIVDRLEGAEGNIAKVVGQSMIVTLEPFEVQVYRLRGGDLSY